MSIVEKQRSLGIEAGSVGFWRNKVMNTDVLIADEADYIENDLE